MPTIPIRIGDSQLNLPVMQNGTNVVVDEQAVRDTVRRRCEKDLRTAIDEREAEHREARKTVKAIDKERILKGADAWSTYEKAKAESVARVDAFKHNEAVKLKPIKDAADAKLAEINREYNAKLATAEQVLAPALTQKDTDIEAMRAETAALIVTETEKALTACRTALAALTTQAEAMAPAAPVVTGGAPAAPVETPQA
jgi:hypothetical protein